MGNLVDVYEEFSDQDKNFILNAWEQEYGQNCTVAIIPFLDKDKVMLALVKMSYAWEASQVL